MTTVAIPRQAMRLLTRGGPVATCEELHERPRRRGATPWSMWRRRAWGANNYGEPIVAMTFNSTAIGVGRAPISIVVRVGFGLPGPAKYSP